MAAAATIAMATTSRPMPVASRSDRNASLTYAASPAATGRRPASSAKDAAESAISMAASRKAKGRACPRGRSPRRPARRCLRRWSRRGRRASPAAGIASAEGRDPLATTRWWPPAVCRARRSQRCGNLMNRTLPLIRVNAQVRERSMLRYGPLERDQSGTRLLILGWGPSAQVERTRRYSHARHDQEKSRVSGPPWCRQPAAVLIPSR